MQPISSDNPWEHGLFGCWHDVGLCILVYFAPCYIEGKISESLHGSFCRGCLCSLIPLVQILHGALERQHIRHQHQIDGSLCADLLVWVFCPFCALTQQAQEVRAWSSDPGERDNLIHRQ